MSTDAPIQVDAAALPDDVAMLKWHVAQLIAALLEETERGEKLERHMDHLVRRLYGRTSEKLDPRQRPLFDSVPEEASAQDASAAEALATTDGVEAVPHDTAAAATAAVTRRRSTSA